MSIFHLIIADLPPIVMEHVISECTDILMRFLPASICNNPVSCRRINSLLKVGQTAVVPFCVAVGLKSLFEDRTKESRCGAICL